MELKQKQLKHLKALAHSLKPVVTIGQNGIKDSIHEEINIALNHHQLIKIKITGADKETRNTLSALITQQHKAFLVQQIGYTLILYRQNKKKDNLMKKAI